MIATNAIKTEENQDLEIFYSVRDNEENEKLFKNTADLDRLYDNPKDKISSLTLRYEISKQSGLTIDFQDKGEIEISGYSYAIDFEYRIDQIVREINRCEQDYNWMETKFALNSKLEGILVVILAGLFMALTVLSVYLIYAKNVGVDISNVDIIPSGNEYYKNVEYAIKSDDIKTKLDTLLVGKLTGFSNVSDVISRISNYIKYSAIAAVVCFICLIIMAKISKLYPLSFFEFGSRIEELKKITRKREIWGTAVIMGFLVNISAGLLIAVLF